MYCIDSTYTRDGKTYEVSASGEAGAYERVYLSYEFTDKQDMKDCRAYRGFAWIQNGEDIVMVSLQEIYIKDGAVFKLWGLNLVNDVKLHYVDGVVDFVAKTMKFEVTD